MRLGAHGISVDVLSSAFPKDTKILVYDYTGIPACYYILTCINIYIYMFTCTSAEMNP